MEERIIVTLKDIAKHADVSTCTVSRYLNANIKVKKETEERIERAIEELRYVPNSVAKSLKQRQTSNVAVILPKLDHLFYSEVTSGISQILGEHQYNVFTYELNNLKQNEDEIIQIMRENMVAGIVFIGLLADNSFLTKVQDLQKWKIPFVYTNRYISYDGFPLIYPDLVRASRLGTDHLVSKSKKNIAFVHKPLPEALKLSFLKGYQEVQGPETKPTFIEITDKNNFTNNVADSILNKKVDGVFVLDQLSAVYLTKALTARNINIPKDVSVVSLGNSLITEISTPELTCVDLNNRELGKRSAEILLNQIHNKKVAPITLIDSFIVEREST